MIATIGLEVRPFLVLMAVSLGSFMTALDVTALNMSLPSIGHNFAVSLDRLQWVAGAYSLVFASLMLTAGSLSDRLGAKSVFTIGLVLFMAASVLCGISGSIASLILARAMQGVGAALMLPSSMALLVSAYPLSTERAKAVAIWGGISAVALVAGLLLGAVVVEFLGWRFIFFLNVPFCLIAFGCVLAGADAIAPQKRHIDLGGGHCHV